MIVRVISVERSKGRREFFKKMNSHIKFDFFNAIDGSKLSKNYIASSNLFEHGLPYTAGAFGCALSHLSLWEEAIAINQVITVSEDDAIFRFDFEEMYSRKLSELPSDWDIVIWGWNFDSVLSLNAMPDISPVVIIFNQDQLRTAINKFQEFKENTTLMRLKRCLGTPAYSISPGGAAKFKSLCFPLTNFELFFPLLKDLKNNGIDIAMNRIYPSTNSFASFPPLVITQNDTSTSLINNNIYI